jgi:acyl dehydratase
MLPDTGETVTYERTFTRRDVERFVAVSNDRGSHHLEPDAEGRVLVHGLLTATLPTKVGGDYNVLATTMTFEFQRPVWTGDTIECAVTFDEVGGPDGRARVTATFECVRERDGETVLAGGFEGVIES